MSNNISISAPVRRAATAAAALPLTQRESVMHLLAGHGLSMVFQPIAATRDGAVFAHEALVRGPAGTALHSPDALLKAAREAGMLYEFEMCCVRLAIQTWGQRAEPGRLFLNLSADALLQALEDSPVDNLRSKLLGLGVQPRMLVVELTEHERVSNMEGLRSAVRALHAAGVALALDDFGDGRSSLRLWSELQPDYVKIDKYFTRDVSRHAHNLLTLKALLQIADTFGTALVAEGLETADDARVIRDLGISYGQGYFLGRPSAQTRICIESEAAQVLNDRRVAVFPERRRPFPLAQLRDVAIIAAPAVTPAASNDEVADIFLHAPELHAVAVVHDERPLAILNRVGFLNSYAKTYFKELHGRKSCVMLANTAPRVVERAHDIDDLVGILTSQDQRYLSDGFIVTENGKYVGLGTGEQLVRKVTEARIEAARHANPLTFLPGNIPISQHLERLVSRGAEFVACYADMNHFKPFNDHYGYWRGDEMIRLAAELAVAHCDPQQDFVGHVGGDDFIWVFQSTDWRDRVHLILDEFNPRARSLFDAEAQARGGIETEDRHGVLRFFPCTTLSVGAVSVCEGMYRTAEQVANAAAFAKQDAKRRQSSLTFVAPSRRA